MYKLLQILSIFLLIAATSGCGSNEVIAMALKGNLVGGKLSGECKYFNSNGVAIIFAQFDDGKKTGKWVHLTAKKDTFKTEFYENDKLVKEKKNNQVFR